MAAKKKKWRVSRFGAGKNDARAVVELYREAFGIEFSLDSWRYDYENGPFGESICHLARAGRKVVGCYRLAPVRVQVRGAVLEVVQAKDFMTHPEYRGEGIASALTEPSIAAAARQGKAFAHAFATGMSYPVCQEKLRCYGIGRIPILFRPLRLTDFFDHLSRAQQRLIRLSLPVYRRFFFLNSSLPPGVTLRRLESFDERADRLWRRIPKTDCIAVQRSSAYLNWRYRDNPRYRFEMFGAFRQDELLGYAIMVLKEQKGVKVGLINELLALDHNPLLYRVLGSRLIKACDEAGAHALGAMMLKHLPYYSVLRSLGVIFLSHEFGFVVRLMAPDLDPAFYADLKSWYLTLGDTDMI